MNRRPFRRFTRWLATLVLGYLILAVCLTTAVDPLRVINAPWRLRNLDASREISENIRLGKAALANRGDWQVVILGSSRMENVFDPTHRAFAGQPTVNLAMAAANLYEIIPVGHYTLDHNPQVKTILLGIDSGDLHNNSDSRTFTNFSQSPFAGGNDRIEHGITWLIGGQAFADSIATLRRHFRNIPPKRDIYGRMLKPNQYANLRQYVELNFSRGFENPTEAWSTNPDRLCQSKVDLLASFLKRVREKGIEMDVMVPPQHALRLVNPTDNTPRNICWEQDILALKAICEKANQIPSTARPIRLWNFFTFHEFNSTPMPLPGAASQQMPGWYDLGHATKSSGDLMIDTLFAGRSDIPSHSVPLCSDLLTIDWAAYKARWIEAHGKYCATHPDDVAWWRGLAARFAPRTKSEAPGPAPE